MNEILIKRVNGTNINIVQEGSDILVPIRPICDALGVTFSRQRKKIAEDPILGPTVALRATVGGDGKQREMVCLPFELVFGWLFTISPDNVASDEAADAVIRYKRECYHALFAHFVKRFRYAQECNEKEIALLSQISELKDTLLANKNELKAAQDRLARMRSERLEFQPTLFDEV
jgi:hypothetical protein